tara:strand:- start:94 stop:351 length:258 start_codon:yes stop_codon:yes gene_type:complete
MAFANNQQPKREGQMGKHIRFCKGFIYGREMFQVFDKNDSIIGTISHNKVSKSYHCRIKKQFGYVFAERHESINEAKKYFLNRFK